MSNSNYRFVACYKWVADEVDIRVGDDLSIDMDHVQYKLSDFDRSAIEAAMRSSESLAEGDSAPAVFGLTFGDKDVTRSLKDALSRGPQEGYYVASAAADEADGRVTAKVLSAAVKAIGDVNCVFTAEGAADTYARQIPARIAAQLDWPLVSSVLDMRIEGDTLYATRKLDDCLQKVSVSLPAVVAVLPEDLEPRTPGLKAIMAAGRKPNHELTAAELGLEPTELASGRSDVAMIGYAAERKNIIYKDLAAKEAAETVVAALRKEGVVK